MKEFTINAIKDTKFRIATLKPLEILAFPSVMKNDTVENLASMYQYIFEHVEVLLADKWLPVKEKNRDVYWPNNIATNMHALREIVSVFINEINSVFQKSEE